jgi:hypothetical protein
MLKMNNSLLKISALVIFCLFSFNIYASETPKHNIKPVNGYVPDAETAIAIAVAVWSPIYGKEKIEKEKPYKARLEGQIWHVTGSLNCPPNYRCLGGAAVIEISKESGEILRVSHGK